MPEYIIDNKNYASDAVLADRALNWLKKVSFEVRTRRQVLDMRYMQFYNAYRCNFDVRFYEGTSQVYIPQLRKQIDMLVAKMKQTLFPTEDLLDAEPTIPEMLNESEVITSFMQWQIDKKVKLKGKIPRFLRQFLMYGWCPVKCIWEQESRKVVGLEKEEQPVMKRVTDPITGEKLLEPTGKTRTKVYQAEKELVLKNNPTFEPIDVFAWYMYPVTCNSIEEAYGCFEVSKQPIASLQEKGRKGDYENTGLLKRDHAEDSYLWQWAQEQRLITDGLTNVDMQDQIPACTVIEYWGKFNWGTEDEPDEQPTVITTAGNNSICLQIRKNPFYDQQIPYLQARFCELQNESYPSGLIEPLITLQYFLNDTLNQTFDALLYEINPIIKYDPGRVVNANTIAFAPGAMWALTDPTAAVFERPPDVSQIGFNAAAQMKQVMEEFAGPANIPLAGRKAATHIQAIQQEYSIPVIEMCQNIELDVFNPWLKMAYVRNQQFVEDEEVFMVTGKRGVKYFERLRPEMLVGDYNFYWKGSSQSTNIHVKTQQKFQFLQSAAPLQPLLAQEGVKLGVSKILRSIWTEGLGFDGGDLVIEEAAQDRGIDPQIENVLLNLGKYVPISTLDDHKMHIQVHSQALQQLDPYAVPLAQRHIQEHNFALQQAAMMGGQNAGQGEPPTGNTLDNQQTGDMMKNEYMGLKSQREMQLIGEQNA